MPIAVLQIIMRLQHMRNKFSNIFFHFYIFLISIFVVLNNYNHLTQFHHHMMLPQLLLNSNTQHQSNNTQLQHQPQNNNILLQHQCQDRNIQLQCQNNNTPNQLQCKNKNILLQDKIMLSLHLLNRPFSKETTLS